MPVNGAPTHGFYMLRKHEKPRRETETEVT